MNPMHSLTITIELDKTISLDFLKLRYQLADLIENKEIGEVWDEFVGEDSIGISLYFIPTPEIEKEIKLILQSMKILERSKLKKNKLRENKLLSGDILQIPLPKKLGYAYAKYIDLQKEYDRPNYPDLLRVFNYKTVKPCSNFKELVNKELLFSPLLVAGLPYTVSKGIWTIVYRTTVNSEEKLIPHYKKFDPPWANDEKDAKQWYYLIDANISKKVKSSYENVKHLEVIRASSTLAIETQIAMAFLIQEGKRVEDYFELKDYYEVSTFENLKNMLPYVQLPEHMKGKALG